MSHSSQSQQILEHLQQHGSITPLEALQDYGCMRLGARILELRQRFNIVTETEKRNGKRYARYRLDA